MWEHLPLSEVFTPKKEKKEKMKVIELDQLAYH
jgi:hypothetical protein